jgi:hypothetical protein
MAVLDDRHHRNIDPTPTTPVRRIRAWLGLAADPPLRTPRAARLDLIQRSWPVAFWQARVSVSAGVPLDDYLRSRLARYLAMLPVPRSRLPLSVDVEDGELVVRAAEPERRAAPRPDDAETWLAPLVAAEGPTVRQEVAELEVKLALLDGDAEAARHRTEEVSRRLAADVAAGLLTAPPGVEATAEQLGRPPLRGAWLQGGLLAFVAAAFLAETWQIALPLLRAAEVDPARLSAEASRRPLETAFAALFALGVSAALFALGHAGVDAAVAASRGDGDPRRRRLLGSAAGAAAVLAALVAAALGGIPAPSARMPGPTFVLLLLAVPLASALILRRARVEAARRAETAAEALAWDRERARALGERARRLEELDWAEEEERELERQRELARRRLRELSARAMVASRLAAEAERTERAGLARLAHSLVGALELDRYEFVRQASARGATALLAPRRRKTSGEPRPALVEAPAPSPSPSSVSMPVGAVEAGRLAS